MPKIIYVLASSGNTFIKSTALVSSGGQWKKDFAIILPEGEINNPINTSIWLNYNCCCLSVCPLLGNALLECKWNCPTYLNIIFKQSEARKFNERFTIFRVLILARQSTGIQLNFSKINLVGVRISLLFRINLAARFCNFNRGSIEFPQTDMQYKSLDRMWAL